MRNNLVLTIILVFSSSCGPTPEEMNDEWFNYYNNTDSAIMNKLSEIMKRKGEYPSKEFCTNEDQLNQESRTGYKADGTPGTNFTPQYWSKIRFEPYGNGTLHKGVKQTPWHSIGYSSEFKIRWYLSLPPSNLSIGGSWSHYNFDGIYILYHSELEKHTQREAIGLLVNDFTKDEAIEFLTLVDSIRNDFMSTNSYVINKNGNFEQNKKAWIDGKKNGNWKKWYNFSSNQKKEKIFDETFYKDGKKNGKSIRYYQNGQKKYEFNYINDIAEGECIFWYENGQKETQLNYKNGEFHGLKTEWYENEQKKEEINYKDGKLDGLNSGWYEEGDKKFEHTFKDGQVNGLAIFWYENGQRSKETSWKDGIQDGLVKEYYRNGKKKFEVNYLDGKPNGIAIGWYQSGKKKVEANFQDGKRIFKKEWNEDGSLKE